MLKKNIYNHAILDCKSHVNLDKKVIKKFITGPKLMENAGREIFKLIKKKFSIEKNIKIICGPGNNGGDGYVVGRLLKENRYKNVYLYLLIEKKNIKGDAKVALNKFDGEINNLFDFKVSNNDLVIDAIFGTGLKRKVTGKISKIIDLVNKKKPYCISVDIPSGIDGDTGEIKGNAIKSNDTITFTKKKPGHLLSSGKEYSGNVIVKNIGINLKKLSFKPYIFENHPDNWKDNFPWPDQKSHKYTRGYTLVICGEKITGASRLSARGAARIGCGLLCLGVPKKSFNIYSTENPIAIIKVVNNEIDLKNLLKDKRINTILIGPGLGINKEKLKLILNIIREKKRKVVLDADALKNNFNKIISKKKSDVVITPHKGEFKSILKSLRMKKKSEITSALNLVKKTKINLVLKGNTTLIISKDGKIAINTNTSPFLATGGSGDVLAGMITGLISQKMNIFDASCAAVWIHGEIAKIKGPGLIAEDLPEMIPRVLKKIKN